MSKQIMLLFDDQYQTWKMGNICACCFSFCECSSTVFVPGLFICSSALAMFVWTQDMETSLLWFLYFRGCDIF